MILRVADDADAPAVGVYHVAFRDVFLGVVRAFGVDVGAQVRLAADERADRLAAEQRRERPRARHRRARTRNEQARRSDPFTLDPRHDDDVDPRPLGRRNENENGQNHERTSPQGAAGVNYNYRFYPICLDARERVRRGDLGSIYSITGGYVQDWLLYPTDYNWRVLASEVTMAVLPTSLTFRSSNSIFVRTNLRVRMRSSCWAFVTT